MRSMGGGTLVLFSRERDLPGVPAQPALLAGCPGRLPFRVLMLLAWETRSLFPLTRVPGTCNLGKRANFLRPFEPYSHRRGWGWRPWAGLWGRAPPEERTGCLLLLSTEENGDGTRRLGKAPLQWFSSFCLVPGSLSQQKLPEPHIPWRRGRWCRCGWVLSPAQQPARLRVLSSASWEPAALRLQRLGYVVAELAGRKRWGALLELPHAPPPTFHSIPTSRQGPEASLFFTGLRPSCFLCGFDPR